MTGKYTFFVVANTSGSLVESIRNFQITTNAPGLSFSSAITLYGTAETSAIGSLIISPQQVHGEVMSTYYAKFSRIYALSGSWVAVTTFTPYGVSNEG